MRDTFKEEVFDGIVKPEIRVIPGAFDHDIGRYISSWTDFAMELEQKKRWATKSAARVVTLADLIDWGNELLKGVTTLNEVEQMRPELTKMHATKRSSFLVD